MPELPEVETIIRGLSRHLIGKRIANVELLWPGLVVGDADETTRQLRGQRIRGIHRHGKYIIVELRRARRKSCLVIHLRMTGNLLINGEPGPYTRGILHLEGGPVLVYHDIRKFGRWQWSPDLPPRLRELGPDPLEISNTEFLQRLRQRHAMAKALLLDQEFLRGLGNIYADEALFRAGIHPRTNTATIGPVRGLRLWEAIRGVLNDAIAQGGSTISNYVDSNGAEGYFQLSTFVYGKTGENCRRCESAIRRIVIASRSTHFCPRCQRR
jgi:formamidopyrimidine-DNA glycosylase